MKIHKCDLCGKFFNAYDEEEKFGLHYSNVGYGSFGSYGSYGNYSNSGYGNKNDKSIKA